MIIRREFEDVPNIGVSDIEFKLNQPSYTIDTLIALEENNSVDEYSIIMGSDNLINFKNGKLQRNFKELFYLRLSSAKLIQLILNIIIFTLLKMFP